MDLEDHEVVPIGAFMDSRSASEGGPVRVLQKSARVLDCFSVETPRLRVAEIVAATGFPTSTVVRILRTLVAENLLQRDGGLYTIGLRTTAWSVAATAGSDLIKVAQPLVSVLRDQCNETCGVYIPQGQQRVCVLHMQSTRSVVYQGHVGQVLPMCAGAGKVFMAFDDDLRVAVVDAGLTAYTSYSVTDTEALDTQLGEIRARGWSFTEQEREVGLNSMAAPVFAASGQVAAAVAIGAPCFRMRPADVTELVSPLRDCARSISQELTGESTVSSSPAQRRDTRTDAALSRDRGGVR